MIEPWESAWGLTGPCSAGPIPTSLSQPTSWVDSEERKPTNVLMARTVDHAIRVELGRLPAVIRDSSGQWAARRALRRSRGRRLDAIVSGSVPDRDPVPDGASDTEAARSRDGGCPEILGQACRQHVEPLDSLLQDFVLRAQPLDALPQGFVLPALPLDAPPQGFDLPGLPPLFRLVLRGQQIYECVDLFVTVGLTDSATRIPGD